MVEPAARFAAKYKEEHDMNAKSKAGTEEEGGSASEAHDMASPSPQSASITTSANSAQVPSNTSSAQGNQRTAMRATLASVRFIKDLDAVPYPQGITRNPDFNFAVTPGRFRYSREFMLQFMNVCKGQPDWKASPESIGLVPKGGRTGGRRVGPMHMGMGSVALQSQMSTELGPGPNPGPNLGPNLGPNPGPLQAKRPRGKRGRIYRAERMEEEAKMSLEPAKPLERSENRWVVGSTLLKPPQVETHVLVEHKVRALLNKLTMDKFDSISEQIIEWANKSEGERDGLTLKQVVKLILKGAQEEAAYSEIYARLCLKMFERISPNVQDETICNAEGQPITGGMLLRKYLVAQCEEFEQEWSGKEAASKVDRHIVPRWGGPWRMIGAGRHGLGMAWFTGELFKLQLLTERTMHEYIKRLLSKFVDPKEEEIEGLCRLFTIVGPSLDEPNARNHVDVYFERLEEIAKRSKIDSRMRYMLLEIIELRARQWQARPTCAIASIARAKQLGGSVRDEVQSGGSRHGEHPGTVEPSVRE